MCLVPGPRSVARLRGFCSIICTPSLPSQTTVSSIFTSWWDHQRGEGSSGNIPPSVHLSYKGDYWTLNMDGTLNPIHPLQQQEQMSSLTKPLKFKATKVMGSVITTPDQGHRVLDLEKGMINRVVFLFEVRTNIIFIINCLLHPSNVAK